MILRCNSCAALLVILFCASTLSADWSSAGDGSYYTPAEIISQSGGALQGGFPGFVQNQSITISAGDTLELIAGTHWQIQDSSGDVELRVSGGVLLARGTAWQAIVFFAAAGQPGDWHGVVLDEASGSLLQFCRIRDAGRGLSVLGGSPRIEFCELHHNFDTGLHCFLGGDPILEHCFIHHNSRYGVEITGDSSPSLYRCIISDNNTESSSPRNAVSVGIQGTNSPQLQYCLIAGTGPDNPASGFSQWLAGDPLLRYCEIRGFRSGVVIQGSGAQGRLENCWIHSNHYVDPCREGAESM